MHSCLAGIQGFFRKAGNNEVKRKDFIMSLQRNNQLTKYRA